MKNQPLPNDLAHFSHLPDLQYRGSNEWSSACPACGGTYPGRSDKSDRFRLFAADQTGNARAWCRSCGHFEWADKESNRRPSIEEIEKAKRIRRKLADANRERLRSRIDALREDEYWRGYHDGMREGQRALWRQAGIPDEFQDFWELGFTPEKKIKYQGEFYTTPALTIPYFRPGRKPVNVQYRLTNPPNPADKYRFTYGLKPDLWLAEPDDDPCGAVLLCEGMKKAAVSFVNLVARANIRLSVLAVPSKHPIPHLRKRLHAADPVYVMLDPDAYTGDNPAVYKFADVLGDRARFVTLPAKVDDLLVQHGWTPDMVYSFVQNATKTI